MRRNIIEDVDLTFLKTTKDKSKYIKFNEEAEKQLNQMEKCKVWTDILQMVQSFTKFIKSHKSFPVVPAKQTFMRRMAQALDPQIPSGVHNQVLDLFVLLFEKIGNERLSYDIWCFTPGLFPLIRTGATDIRIKCLQIVKTHLLSIIKTIPEMHRSLVVAVVVGMEENSSGIKDKTIEILDALKDGNEKYFWETCWDVLRVNPVSRKPLLVYLHLRLSIPFENNQTPTKEQLLYSVLNTLSDDKSLVLREMLDIVCTRMRLDSGIFTKTQMTSLLERMFLLLPKKDSGLTRRVHFYLLGLSAKTQDTQQEEMLEYFTNYSSSIVETALINLFNYFNKTGVEKIIGISEELLGKQVIGEQVIGTIIKSVVLLLKDSQEDGNRENVSKIIEFLSKVDATILFDYVISLINDSDNESRIGTVFSFLNSYQGDEEQMKLFDTLCVNTSMKTCDYLKTVIEENGTIEQIEECLNLIDFCLKDGIVAQNEKDLEILKLTIEINNTFHCFIEKYIKNDTEIRDTKFAAFLQFCEIIRVLHTELSPFKRKNIEICDISKEEEKDQEEEEEMGIESIEILMRKEVRLNGWINSLKDLITNHSQPIIRVKATKCYYDIWKKDERDSFDLNNIEFIKKMFNSLWDCLNPENYPILTDIVLFFHTLGAQHIQTTYDFITEKVKTRSEEQLCKYVLFWKHSTVLVYDVDTSPFNRALLFFLQHFIYENHDPFFHDFLSTSLNIQTIERIIPPLLTILLTPNEMRESHYFGFEINDSLIEKHLQILDTLVCCSNSKLIDSLESTSIPRSLLNLYKELNVQNYVQNLDAPTNLLSLIFHTLILYVKKVSILVKQTSTYSFSFQSLGVNVLLHLSTFYGEMSSIQQICVSMQYPILIVFAESISACPKLQLHLISLVKQIMKISDVTEPTQCITRYSLFLQTCISGLCQEKYVYRSLFFTFINDILPLIPISEYKSSVILLMQAVSNVVSQTCNLSSPHILVLSEEVNPIIDIQKHLFDYTLTLFPYKNPFPLNEQQTQHSASQQIGNAVLFIPLLVVSVFTDGKGSKEKQKIEPHFLTASLRQTISSFVDLFLYTTKSNNPFLVQSNCVSFLETLLTVFPHEFIGEYLLLFDVFPDEHATIFRSFRPETTLTILWALIVLSEANVYNDVSPKQINNFIQFFIEKVITPRELYTTQMYIQTLISYHSTNDEMIFSLIHTLKLFLVSISQIEQKYPMKLGNGWQELISSLISKYTTILQRWKLEGLQQRHEKRKSSISQIDFETPKLDDKNVQPTTQPNSSNITSTEINIFTEDIIPIICMTSEESTISTLDLGKTYELLLQQPCADMDMSLAAVNVLIGITKKNQLVGRWNRIVVSAFNENEFFKKPVELLSLWREPISNAFLSNNHRAFLDILYGFAKGILTQGPLFGTKENEAIHRGRLLKRLAFVIYSSEPETFDSIVDQNIPVIEQVMDRIIDTLKTHPHTSVYVNGFLLLRVVLLRCSFTKLRKKIPTVLNELINIFNTPFERDAAIILAGLQVVDMLNIIPESTLDLHTWIFFSPYSPEFTEQSQYFQPLIHGLALNANDGDSTPKQQNWTPNITLQGLEQKRELVITATRLNDMRDYQNLRIELDSYRKELFQVTSRSSELDLNSMNKLLLQSFGEL